MNNDITCGGTDLSKKPKYVENFWKNLIFIYACLILSVTLSLSVNSINFSSNSSNKTNNNISNSSTSIVLDVLLSILYLLASSIIIAIFIYLHINRHQTYEEAKKENSKSSEVYYSMCGENVGIYLRAGVVLIGSFSLIYIILFIIKSSKSTCTIPSGILNGTTEILFFLIQTIFILRYHSVVILRKTRLIKFGLYNVVFINIAIWEISSLAKIKYSSAETTEGDCSNPDIEKLYLYFLPTIGEYCVICMAILYEIMKRLGKISLIETSHSEEEKKISWKIRKSLSGVVIGIFIVLCCIGFTIFIIYQDLFMKQKDKNVFIVHEVEEIVMYIFSTIILIFAFLKTNQLKFSFTYLSNNVDKNLLFVSCFLSIAFSVLVTTFCFQYSLDNPYMLVRALAGLLEIFQIIIQTYVIQDCFYRCSINREQQETKPGQAYLAILIGCNFGMWIFKSFQLKNGDIFFHKSSPIKDAKNYEILSFFVYLTLPLSILYRFHSSSCLADVFSKIYQGEVCRFENLLRAEGFEKCGMGAKIDSNPNLPQIVVQDGSPKLGRPRAITLPVIPAYVVHEPKGLNRKKMTRRETIKNLETAKLRVLSSHFSHSMISKKLSSTVSPSLNSSTLTLNDIDLDRSPKLYPRFHSTKKSHAHSDTEMPTIKQLVVSNLFHGSLKRRKSEDDQSAIVLKTVKFVEKPISEHFEEEE